MPAPLFFLIKFLFSIMQNTFQQFRQKNWTARGTVFSQEKFGSQQIHMVHFVCTVTWSQLLSHPCGRKGYSSIHASQSFNEFRAQLLKMYKRDRHRMILLWIFYEQVWVHAVCLKQKTAQFATRAGSVLLCLAFKASEKSWARKTTKQRHGRDTMI